MSQALIDDDLWTRVPNWFVGTPRVTIDFGGVSPFRSRHADGWAAVDVHWMSRCLFKDDAHGCPAVWICQKRYGIDWVTGRYDEPRTDGGCARATINRQPSLLRPDM